MKKLIILVIALVLVTGYVMADRGIVPVPETQGIVTSTSVNGVGNFASATDMQWRIADDRRPGADPSGLPDIPPLPIVDAAIYESIYTEDTQTHGVGLMLYDKELDIETSGQISGQWNVEATKQIAFVGIDGAAVVSSDSVMVDGAASMTFTSEQVICPFARDITQMYPNYCNRAQAGSTIDMTVANVRTTTTDRFVTPSADHPVELNHDIRVTELITDVPSQGMASASMEVLIQEAYGGPFGSEIPLTLAEHIEFSEETSFDGAITLFDKLMHYESGMVR